MNLIKNTLLSIIFLQLIVVLYIKIFHNKTITHQTKQNTTITTQPIITKSFSIENYIISYKSMQTEQKKKSIAPRNDCTKIVNKQISIEKKPFKKPPNTNSKLETYAKKFLGNKYVWGATGPKTFDCSGFTQAVYRQCAGIHIPRVSRDQAKVGKYIKFANLKQGDMVFFDTTKKHLGKVNHVGIYLGKGDFIHASSGGKRVMITNFNKKRFYKKRFLWGRRITQEYTAVTTLIQHKNREES